MEAAGEAAAQPRLLVGREPRRGVGGGRRALQEDLFTLEKGLLTLEQGTETIEWRVYVGKWRICIDLKKGLC